MKAREPTKERLILEATTYVVVAVARNGQPADYHFLPPSALAFGEIVGSLDNRGIHAMSLMADPDGEMTLAGLALTLRNTPSLLKGMAALLGVSWYNRQWDLETPRRDDDDWLKYGAAVYEELHQGGFNLEAITVAALGISEQVMEAQQVSVEVRKRISFFGKAPPAKNGAPSSSSDNGTTPTSTPGMD